MLIKSEKSFFQLLFIRLKKLIFIICSIVLYSISIIQDIGERILLIYKNIHKNINNEIN